MAKKEIEDPSHKIEFGHKPEYSFGQDWFEVYELNDGVLAIREPRHFEDVFSFLLRTDNGTVLIDTGMGLANIASVLPETPLKVLLTHSHWDHIGGVQEFNTVAILNNPYEVSRVKQGWQRNETVGYEESAFTVPIPTGLNLEKFAIPGARAVTTFEDQQVLTIDGLEILVIHTPGHTPGSTCFFIPKTGVLITGDTLYPGPEYLHLPESSVVDYTQSLIKIRELLAGKITSILPGHNAPTAAPELLDRHIAGLLGELPPAEIITGIDEFGAYQQKKFGDFSLMLPA